MSVASRTFLVHLIVMDENERTQFKLMLPALLKATLEKEAYENHRSLSAEIVARLEQSVSDSYTRSVLLKKFPEVEGIVDAIFEDIVKRLSKRRSEAEARYSSLLDK